MATYLIRPPSIFMCHVQPELIVNLLAEENSAMNEALRAGSSDHPLVLSA